MKTFEREGSWIQLGEVERAEESARRSGRVGYPWQAPWKFIQRECLHETVAEYGFYVLGKEDFMLTD